MFIDVYPYLQMLFFQGFWIFGGWRDDYRCWRMFTDVGGCLQMLEDVYRYWRMFASGTWAFWRSRDVNMDVVYGLVIFLRFLYFIHMLCNMLCN